MQQDDMRSDGVEVFRGSSAGCSEHALVLDAKGLGYERVAADGCWSLTVAPALHAVAAEELRRYAAERHAAECDGAGPGIRREPPGQWVAFAGSGVGAGIYAFILILVAYCAGAGSFGVDWLSAGSIEAGAGLLREWWRPVTALTLHLDQEHLLGNLLFGIGIGTLAGRVLGPGLAWLGILLAGAFGNAIEMLISPAGHRAAGASTAVFAALGLLAGLGWRSHRWPPLFGGICLLVLLGAGTTDRHVDVLGHLLGFLAGTALGWAFARLGIPHGRHAATQWCTAAAALVLLTAAWAAALTAFH